MRTIAGRNTPDSLNVHQSSILRCTMRSMCLSLAGLLAMVDACAGDSSDLSDWTLEQLMEIKVYSVDRSESSSFSVPAAITIITRSEIEDSASQSLTDLLAHVPGLYVREMNRERVAVSSRNDTQTYLSNLLLLVDGQTLSPPTTNTPYWPAFDIPLDAIERIEVIHGSGTPLWGSNAFGGIINIITRKAKTGDAAQLRARSGNGGYAELDGEWSVGTETQQLRLMGSTWHDNGYDSSHSSDLQHRIALLRYDGHSGDDWHWNAQVRDSRYDGTDYSLYTQQPSDFFSRNDNVHALIDYAINADNKVEASTARANSEVRIGSFDFGSSNDWQEYDLHYAWSALTASAQAGVNRRHHEIDANRSGLLYYRNMPQSIHDDSIYGLWQWQPLASLRWDVSARREYYSMTDEGGLTSWGTRLSYEFSAPAMMWASVNHGYQQPNLGQMRQVGYSGHITTPISADIYIMGRDDLQAEIGNDRQLGLRWQINSLQLFDIALFHDAIDQQIYLDTRHPVLLPGPPLALAIYDINQIDSVSYGGEMNWRVQWRDYCRFDVGYSYYHETAKSTTGAVITAPPYAPHHKADVTADCKYDRHSLTTRALWESAYSSENVAGLFANPDVYNRVSPHWRLDLAWHLRLTSQWRVELSALNVFNHDVMWDYVYGWNPPTSVTPRYWLGIAWRGEN